MRLIAAFAVAAAAGYVLMAAVDGDPAAYRRGAPVPGSDSIEGTVADAYGRPPGVPRDSSERGLPQPPPWSVLVWRTRDGRTCHEAGPVVSDATPGRGDQIPGVRHTASNFPKPLVGSLRPDSKSGTGIQFYDLGRFLGYPMAEGGSCGDPRAGAGLLLSREYRHARRDLGPDRTVISGVASPGVRSVVAGGRTLPLSRRRAFIALYDGIHTPRELPVTVTYADGSTRRFAGG